MADKRVINRNVSRLFHQNYYAAAEYNGEQKRKKEAEEAKSREDEEIDRVCRYILGIPDDKASSTDDIT